MFDLTTRTPITKFLRIATTPETWINTEEITTIQMKTERDQFGGADLHGTVIKLRDGSHRYMPNVTPRDVLTALAMTQVETPVAPAILPIGFPSPGAGAPKPADK